MKKLIGLLPVLALVFALAGCNTNSMNYIIENRPSITGIVETVDGNAFILCTETAEGYPSGIRWCIPLSPENPDSYTTPAVGDEVVVYYDGMAMETDPLQIRTVYAITLKTPADRTQNNQP